MINLLKSTVYVMHHQV